MHLNAMNEELSWFDKLATVFLHFNYRERYGWSFDKYVEYVQRGVLQEVLGNDMANTRSVGVWRSGSEVHVTSR